MKTPEAATEHGAADAVKRPANRSGRTGYRDILLHTFPSDLYNRVKVEAAKQGTTIQMLLPKLVKRGLSKRA